MKLYTSNATSLMRNCASLLVLACSMAMVASPAMAQTQTGEISVTNNVAIPGFSTCAAPAPLPQCQPNPTSVIFDFTWFFGAFTLGDGGTTFRTDFPVNTSLSVEQTPNPGFDTVIQCDSTDTIKNPLDPMNIVLDPGEQVFCVATNTVKEPGRIDVFLETDPDGSAQSFDFSGSWGGNFSLTDGQVEQITVLPGTWGVAEVPNPDWTSSSTCEGPNGLVNPFLFDVATGDNVVCRFNKFIKRGRLELSVRILDGSDATFSFNVTGPQGFSAQPSVTTSGGLGLVEVSNTLYPGLYEVTELNTGSYLKVSSKCTDGTDLSGTQGMVTLDPDEDLDCGFEYDTQQAPPPVVDAAVPVPTFDRLGALLLALLVLGLGVTALYRVD